MHRIGFLILFLIMAIHATSIAQTQKLDSLKRELSYCDTKTDSVNILNSLVFSSWYKFKNDAFNYGQQSLKLSKEISDRAAIGWANFAGALGYQIKGNLQQAKYLYKSTYGIGMYIKSPSLIAWSSYQLFNISLNQGYIIEANIYLELGFNSLFQIISKKLPEDNISVVSDQAFKKLINDVQRSISNREFESSKTSYYFYYSSLHNAYGNRKEAMNNIYKAMDLALQAKDDFSLMKSYYQTAYYFTEIQKNYPMALRYYLNTIEFEQADNTINKYGYVYLDIARLHRLMGNDSLAMNYIDKCIARGKLQNNMQAVAAAYVQLGDFYASKNQHEKAIACYSSVPEKYFPEDLNKTKNNEQEHIGDKFIQLDEDDYAEKYFNVLYHEAQTNLGEYYFKHKKYEKAYTHIRNGYSAIDNRVNFRAVVRSYQAFGNLSLAFGDKVNAIEYFKKAYKFSHQIFYLEGQRDNSLRLSRIFIDQKDDLQAYKFLEVSNALSDSINKMNIADRHANLETWFDFINLEAQNTYERTKSKFYFVGLVLTIIILILLYLAYNRKKKQKMLVESMSKKIHESDKAKLQFFTNLSHEFRTPLTLIISPLERIINSLNGEKEKNELSVILKNAKKLKGLVNQQLDVEKSENDNVKLEKHINDFSHFFIVTSSMFSSIADTQNIKYTIKGYNKKLVFSFDKSRMEHVITNLLANAFKYTNEGGNINISLNSKNNNLIISVKDSGPGIPYEEQGKIFKRFYQANSSYEGTGLGLTIAKEYVELHDGTITLKSEPGFGSEFIVRIPIPEINEENIHSGINIEADEYESIYNESLIPGKKHFNKNLDTLLVVEDNYDLREYLSQLFQASYNVLLAKNGKEGKEMASDEDIDLIISDVMMPVYDGYEMTKDLKSSIETSHIPIILLTAKARQADKISGYKIGADDYIEKPFDEKELELKVQNILATRKNLQTKFKSNLQTKAGDITVSSIDEKILSKITSIVEDNISNSDFNIEQLCTEAGISRRNLFRKLKALTGMSPSEFIRIIRLKRAAQLLKQKAGSVSEVAYQTGFENLSYFTKCFKDAFQKRPSEYK